MDNSNSFLQQVRRNHLALLSLLVALSALFYNTWRNESTEANRNVRAAEFEMLKSLAELQQVIDYAHFRMDKQRGDPTRALTLILQINDLGTLTPPAVKTASENLLAAWRKNGDKVMDSLDAASAMSEEVLNTRRTVLESLRSLR
ncbi:hypothetical protein [Undibacterium terreum]|uniref:Uncharacterized protein n=1 Tax=Undibacterium terreum TaxID=1224302 RepID=A0A916UMY1_9BURK|nr:hypothetical protein [Undibacterium terreum]GGC79935.1 hypothetical protein GCM10011396_29030 [Undibacterium terreum]